MEQEQEMKIEYLHLIQEPISRMSTTSAIFKGFTATIVAGISLISYASINALVLFLSFFPVLSFALLDLYYLSLERKLRFLYKSVINGNQEIDFSINLNLDDYEMFLAKARICDCVKSPSFYYFYPVMLMVLFLVFLFQCMQYI